MEQVNKLSDRLVQFIGIVFAVVVAESFARYSTLIVHPEDFPLAFVGLLAIYVTMVLSWVRYHQNVPKYPYKENTWGWLRFGGDFAIVGLYAFLLYSLIEVQQHGNLARYLWSFAFIFSAYLLVGIFRIKEHADSEASNWKRLLKFLCCLVPLAVVYQFVMLEHFPTTLTKLNWLFLLVPPLLNFIFTYKWWRKR